MHRTHDFPEQPLSLQRIRFFRLTISGRCAAEVVQTETGGTGVFFCRWGVPSLPVNFRHQCCTWSSMLRPQPCERTQGTALFAFLVYHFQCCLCDTIASCWLKRDQLLAKVISPNCPLLGSDAHSVVNTIHLVVVLMHNTWPFDSQILFIFLGPSLAGVFWLFSVDSGKHQFQKSKNVFVVIPLHYTYLSISPGNWCWGTSSLLFHGLVTW